ncbi:MAG TPA: cytochrome c oxidase assembly protein [Chloroflexota bacterium]
MASQLDAGWSGWHADPSILLGLALLCCWYAWAARRLDRRGEGPRRRQRLWLVVAVVAMLVALTGPLHDLSDNYLFTAHMTQHLLLMLVFPPALLLSLAPGMLRPLLRPRWVGAAARFVTRPVIAFGLCNAVFAVSHLPPFYDLTLRNHDLHVVEHLLFIATATLLWWPLLSPLPELPSMSYGAQLLYLFLQVLPGSLIGGLIANSERALYPFYAAAPRVSPLSAVQDQQLGAIVMWVGGGTFFLIAFSVVFFRWAAQDMAESRAQAPPPSVRAGPPGGRGP